MLRVFFREQCFFGWNLPINTERCIKDADATICLRCIEIIALVLEDSGLAQDSKAMSETTRYEDLTKAIPSLLLSVLIIPILTLSDPNVGFSGHVVFLYQLANTPETHADLLGICPFRS